MKRPALVDVIVDDAAKGFVVRDGDYLSSRVEFAAGPLTGNGKTVPMGGKPP